MKAHVSEGSTFLHPTKTLEAVGIYGGMKVADFGAGSGFFTRAAARLVVPDGTVWAVDTQSALLDRVMSLSLAEGLQNVEIIKGDVSIINGTHLSADSFDLVIVSNLLFMLEAESGERIDCLKEAYRILKPGGRVLLVDWSASHGGLGPESAHVITLSEAEDISEEVGFRVLDEVPAGNYHWGLIMSKKK